MKKYIRPLIIGAGVLTLGVVSWFGYKGKTSPTSDNTQESGGGQARYGETSIPLPTATSTETNTTSGYIFASDGTPFEIVNFPGYENGSCVKVGGPFENVDGEKHNVFRATEALGNGVYSNTGFITVTEPDGTVTVFDARLRMPPENLDIISPETTVCLSTERH